TQDTRPSSGGSRPPAVAPVPDPAPTGRSAGNPLLLWAAVRCAPRGWWSLGRVHSFDVGVDGGCDGSVDWGRREARAYGSTSTVCRGPLSANSGDPGNPLVPPRSGPAPIPPTTAARPAGGAVPCGTRGPGTPPAAGPLR